MDDLKAHPTTKPIGLVADAMKDCRPSGTVLDTFSGSGTTIFAAERVRTPLALELEPRFVDVALRRWQSVSGRDAIHIVSGRNFDEIALSSVNSPTTPLALAA
jgi:DNA modification methylase